MKTMNDVCEEIGITRRVVQGYQKKGLVQPDSHNKYGYLLFSEETVDRIAFIRYCQKLNLLMDEIVELFDKDYEEIVKVIAQKNDEMKTSNAELQQLVERTEKYLAKENLAKDNKELMKYIREEIL